jgi:hypothetical protein
MASETVSDEKSGGISESRGWLLGLAAGVVLVMFFIDDCLGSINGGGIFPYFQNIMTISQNKSMIGIDHNGLRTAFTFICGIFGVVFCWNLDFDFSEKQVILITAFSIMIAGFVSDWVLDEQITTWIMSEQGYIRCDAQDYEAGSGKGAVWLNIYVRNNSDCSRK